MVYKINAEKFVEMCFEFYGVYSDAPLITKRTYKILWSKYTSGDTCNTDLVIEIVSYYYRDKPQHVVDKYIGYCENCRNMWNVINQNGIPFGEEDLNNDNDYYHFNPNGEGVNEDGNTIMRFYY
jgi:hypothetical protein